MGIPDTSVGAVPGLRGTKPGLGGTAAAPGGRGRCVTVSLPLPGAASPPCATAAAAAGGRRKAAEAGAMALPVLSSSGVTFRRVLAHFPQELSLAFAYGSGVFRQAGPSAGHSEVSAAAPLPLVTPPGVAGGCWGRCGSGTGRGGGAEPARSHRELAGRWRSRGGRQGPQVAVGLWLTVLACS